MKLIFIKFRLVTSVVPVRKGLKSLYLAISKIMPVSLCPGVFGEKDFMFTTSVRSICNFEEDNAYSLVRI